MSVTKWILLQVEYFGSKGVSLVWSAMCEQDCGIKFPIYFRWVRVDPVTKYCRGVVAIHLVRQLSHSVFVSNISYILLVDWLLKQVWIHLRTRTLWSAEHSLFNMDMSFVTDYADKSLHSWAKQRLQLWLLRAEQLMGWLLLWKSWLFGLAFCSFFRNFI